jgi:mitochondrial fission protein ELM1
VDGKEHPAPLVWLLTGDKGGDNGQLRMLAAALGLPSVEKALKFNNLYRVPNGLLGATGRSLARASRAGIGPPWPDLVLSSGRRATPVARWIRAQSHGRAKLVNVGRPWGALAAFDLVIAMPQYGVPARDNVLPLRLPFNRLDPAVVARAADATRSRLAGLRPPYLAVLIGGRARPLKFDAETGCTIGHAVDALARELNASVLAVTSRRTQPDVADALLSQIQAPILIHRWRADDPTNAYAGFIGLADRIVVTADSASMIAEACRSGKPVTVAPVPLDDSLRERLPRLLWASLPRGLVDALHAGGWIVLPRRISDLWRPLQGAGHVHVLGMPLVPTSPPPDDLATAVQRIRVMLGQPRPGAPDVATGDGLKQSG